MKFFAVFVPLLSLVIAADWTYDDVDNWKDTYPLCGGNSQTPINIDMGNAVCDISTLNIQYLNDPIKAVTLKNDGHTVVFDVSFQKQNNKTLRWDLEKAREYIFHSAHLHWGPICGGGSEHTINGHRYAAELHLVHYNAIYKTLSEAAPQTDGLAVLGILLELAEESTNDGTNRNNFVQYLSNIATKQSSYTVSDTTKFKTIKDLIKNNVKNFYSYKGSLTTPPCYQSVRWFVSTDPIMIYPSEMKELLKLYPNNFRPIQETKKRFVREYRNGCGCRC